MNEKTYTLTLLDFTERSTPYGSAMGRDTHAKLLNHIDNLHGISVIGISFAGMATADGTFLRESLIYTIKRYSKEIFFFVFDIPDDDMFSNIKTAAINGNQQLTCWLDDACQIVGPETSASNKALLELVVNHRFTTTSKAAEELNISVQNASTRLKRLSEEGFLMRTEEAADTGGKEFIYQVIGKSA